MSTSTPFNYRFERGRRSPTGSQVRGSSRQPAAAKPVFRRVSKYQPAALPTNHNDCEDCYLGFSHRTLPVARSYTPATTRSLCCFMCSRTTSLRSTSELA